jgi:hypothetical protein
MLKTNIIRKRVGIMEWHYNKRFSNVFVGLLRNVNDSRVLHNFF